MAGDAEGAHKDPKLGFDWRKFNSGSAAVGVSCLFFYSA